MKPEDTQSEKWQLRRWEKGTPYGVATELDDYLIDDIRSRLLDASRRVTGKRDLLIFDILLNTGCYFGEIYDLKMSDLALPAGDGAAGPKESIVLHKSNSKYHSRRSVPVSLPLYRSIRHYADLSKEWVCWSQVKEDDERINKIHLSYMIYSWGKPFGIRLRAHSFRKAFLRKLALSGADIETLKKISGYKSIQSLSEFLPPGPAATVARHSDYGNGYEYARELRLGGM